ncbi:aminoacetone oxidase family FAD-binding enzyme [Pseudobutyrivibrio ruminis]|uniref:Aminoacetone oxidase family FAD-binding enzyme n=1 Tax=Pseudobutyrivibrio ruminis TaxID=46206 RepID=A0A2G3EE23_9FIRM|nr:NAD(P)/FAD-dependent oxidoreductase [Pseudobutyrivibrio ruminis]PHU41510.1 aminoacetone oxidase family FAD-binding enzyme [Pseudobutyrivibrio ruminis]
MSNVIVIGGGAAGLMAGYAAGICGHQVTILEKNEKLGKKIYITGKGRCNFTNACDTEDFFKNVVSNPKFLYSALYTFSPDSMIGFVESQGIPTKVERGNRAFPESDHASDITKALEKAIKEYGVNVRLRTEVKDILIEDNKVIGVKLSDGSIINCDNVILCTGGLSYQTTGSTGDGLKWARKIGLKVTECRPALVPLNCKESYIRSMQGLALKNVNLTIKVGKKKLYDSFGEMLFTHFGVSGPLVLSASSIIGKRLQETGELQALVDLKPALSVDELSNRVLRDFNDNMNKHLSSVLRGLLPSSMVPVFIELMDFDDSRQINSITKEERANLIALLKAFPFTITGLREYKEAIITQGGISVKEVDPSTMKCKNIEGLSFAGEVLDLDAFTGGFNLQIAWSTGYLAGLSI